MSCQCDLGNAESFGCRLVSRRPRRQSLVANFSDLPSFLQVLQLQVCSIARMRPNISTFRAPGPPMGSIHSLRRFMDCFLLPPPSTQQEYRHQRRCCSVLGSGSILEVSKQLVVKIPPFQVFKLPASCRRIQPQTVAGTLLIWNCGTRRARERSSEPA
jgi:hypothetical protein